MNRIGIFSLMLFLITIVTGGALYYLFNATAPLEDITLQPVDTKPALLPVQSKGCEQNQPKAKVDDTESDLVAGDSTKAGNLQLQRQSATVVKRDSVKTQKSAKNLSTMTALDENASNKTKTRAKPPSGKDLSTTTPSNVDKLSTSANSENRPLTVQKQSNANSLQGETPDSTAVAASESDFKTDTYRQMQLTAEKIKLKAARQGLGTQIRTLLRNNGYLSGEKSEPATTLHQERDKSPSPDGQINDTTLLAQNPARQHRLSSRSRWGIGLNVGALYPSLADQNLALSAVSGAKIKYRLHQRLHVALSLGAFRLTTGEKFAANAVEVIGSDLQTQLFVQNHAAFRSFFQVGIGLCRFSGSHDTKSRSSRTQTAMSMSAGAGVEVDLHKNLALSVTLDVRQVKGAIRGSENNKDRYVQAEVGVVYYFDSGNGAKPVEKNPLLAQQE